MFLRKTIKSYLVFEKGFAFRNLCVIALNSFFVNCFASPRPLMESIPIIRSQLELSQVSPHYRYQFEYRDYGGRPIRWGK